MEQDNSSSRSAANADELEFRRYAARLGVWKVVFGTCAVGVVGGLLTFVINFYNAYVERERKAGELLLAQQAAHQRSITDFFNTAIDQNIELRIRFADYFAHLAGPERNELWKKYLEDLIAFRQVKRNQINDLEKKLVDFKKLPQNLIDNAEFDRISRELEWAKLETGYAPVERSAVIALADNSPFGKKVRLYKETTDLVRRLSSGSQPLSERSADLDRFWVLYRKDLIGVESGDFARTMVATGQVLNSLSASNSPPDEELKRLAEQLVSISRQELADVSQGAVRQQ